MDKTVTVLVERRVKHPVYGKVDDALEKVSRAQREQRGRRAGDLVEIEECRPISKTKAWRVTRVAQQAVQSRNLRRSIRLSKI